MTTEVTWQLLTGLLSLLQSILGNPSGLWSTTPFSSSIWSSNLNSGLPFTTPTNALSGIDLMGSENSSPPPPSTAAAVANPAEDMGQTYNPWRIWSPTIGRRSSDPWSNSHYPHENWNLKSSKRKGLSSRSWNNSECGFLKHRFQAVAGHCFSFFLSRPFPSFPLHPTSHAFTTCSFLKSVLRYGSVRLQISLKKSGCGHKSKLQLKPVIWTISLVSYFTICHFHLGNNLNYKTVLACNTFMKVPVLVFKFFPVLPSKF